MSKGILVIDMPERCSMCKFLQKETEKCRYCRELGLDCSVGEYMKSTPNGKADWCPLKEVPKKMAEETRWFDIEYAKGYNACIDEILKEN